MTDVVPPDLAGGYAAGYAASMREISTMLDATEAALARTERLRLPPPSLDVGPRTAFKQRGVYWLRYGDGLEAVVIADRDGTRRCVARFVIPDPAHRWWVDRAAWALLDAYDPRRGEAADDYDDLWTWKRPDADGRVFGLPVLAKLTRAGAIVVECSAARAVEWRAWDAIRALHLRLGADAPGLAHAPRELAGCHAEKVRGGLVMLGDYVDGRRRYHARRRAEREALAPAARPTLSVIRTSVPRVMARSITARRPRPSGDAA